MDILLLIGRVLFGTFFIINGFNHLTKFNMLKGYAQSKGVPVAGLAIIITGFMIILGGLSILLGAYVQIGVVLLAVFLVPTSVMIHNFWTFSDPQEKMGEMVNFMKNMGLLGGALLTLGIQTPWAFALNLG